MFKNIVLVVVLYGFLALGVIGPTRGANPENQKVTESVENSQIMDDLKEIEAQLLNRISDEVWWHEAGQKEIANTLKVVANLRSVKAIPVLVDHIEYQRDGMALQRMDNAFPVMAVLVEIGSPAIPKLVDVIKAAPADIGAKEPQVLKSGKVLLARNREQVAALAVLTIQRIADKIGDGQRITMWILRDEIQSAKNQLVRKRLRMAMRTLTNQGGRKMGAEKGSGVDLNNSP